jgi:hypothetical protein
MTPGTSLLPREHGAYAELAFPLLTALTIAQPTVAGAAFALSAVAWFLAHEPLAVTMRMRGARVLAESGDRARRRVLALAALGASAGTLALAAAPAAARWAAVIPLGAVVLLVPAYVLRRHKTLSAEALVVLAFAGMVLPVSIAAGVEWRTGLIVAGVWFVSLMLGTLAVHALKDRHKHGRDAGSLPRLSPALGGVSAAVALGVAAKGLMPWPIALALVPPALLTTTLGSVHIHPRHLKRVGWSLVAANTVTWICLLFL